MADIKIGDWVKYECLVCQDSCPTTHDHYGITYGTVHEILEEGVYGVKWTDGDVSIETIPFPYRVSKVNVKVLSDGTIEEI